ncbi:hypothetical protein IWW55_000367 [Coemansia sp. RSA 2706]|nr:hypothetical protein IWW55_000367 [Coemansia sp. RSA 2706]KAJ2315137.1 hypothetical protein IWW54_000486 [Coemansia sp. RSA 2705]KAJ2321826.1 hypothetical protein IWW52_000484 [Coemansia sp. RSA 2704]KAJ2328793.1 hypothetical protein IWW51_000991 [Coemansia sp. RSA 2702]KAJ2370050.1 hypothetical protein H4S01_000621 [Coemansia sp. RSA 2610]KAJ2391725.1 hypothetical protein H4S02_001174 [Coemansia sp. RSA 2611]KAJ2731019.1 hypothetical protein H4R23_003172 [Coemansia sp. Cherry 401B]
MTIQLTRGLLNTFLGSAQSKSQATLGASTLTPFVFANTALLWLVPASVNHPLRRVLGLSTAFILITSAAESAGRELKLQRTRVVSSGAKPLASWQALAASEADGVGRLADCGFEWGVQRMQPVDRNQARELTAQYAQILPELRRDAEAALPMLVFTQEIDRARRPFYLVVFSPESPAMFANVAALRTRDQSMPSQESVRLLEQAAGDARVQHWAEYELLGSPAQAEESAVDGFRHSGADTGIAESACGSELSVSLAASMSYVVLHGIWDSASRSRDGDCTVDLPPAPALSAQWVLELVSVPLAQEPDASRRLAELAMEIQRLEAWCASWTAGVRWVEAAPSGESPVTGAHPWQAADTGSRRNSADNTTTIDESQMHVDAQSPLAQHRQQFGQRVDAFIDAAIYNTRGASPRAQARDALDDELPARGGLDFGERLWNLAHHARDDDDLAEALAAVAEALETRKLQPFVHHDNQTPLAQVVRQTLQLEHTGRLADVPAERERLAAQLDLWVDELPLDPFVHLGLHKLRADLRFHFVMGKLATPQQVDRFLDPNAEPELRIARFWMLLRVLEVWLLVRQAAPGMPRQLACQIVSALFDHFAPALDENDESDETTNERQATAGRPQYDDWLRVCAFLPVYSTEVQRFAEAVADGFDPARYTATAADSDPRGGSRYALVQLTKTPVLVDLQYAADHLHLDAFADGASQASAALDEYTVFEARHL